MPVDTALDFSQAILDEAKQEAEGILDLARREAERILEGARDELDQIYVKESPQTATQMAKTRYKQIVAAAELEVRKQQLLAREELIADVQKKVQSRMLEARADSSYPDLLRRLAIEGLAGLDGEQFEMIVAPEDRSLLTQEMLNELEEKTGKTVVLSEHSAPGITGVIVQRADQHVRCDNSLQAIFQRQEHDMRLLIARNLFEDID